MAFRAPDRTLTDEELDGYLHAIAEHVSSKLGAQVRDW
jgi:phenylalanyl-tRNA synthetase beta subunit